MQSAYYVRHICNKRQGTSPPRNISSKKGGNRNLFVRDNNAACDNKKKKKHLRLNCQRGQLRFRDH
jgi:hypothetical protein